MKEIIEKLIGRLEEKKNKYQELADSSNFDGWAQEEKQYLVKEKMCEEIIKIVNQLAEEYKGGWIPCSERLPQESEPVGTLCEIVNVMLKNGMVTSGWCNRYLEKWYVLDHHHDYPLPCEYKDVIAWMPLPAPYKEGCE